jgi:hypothetical protein
VLVYGNQLCILHFKSSNPFVYSSCSRPYPTAASAYVELQQQLLQRFAEDAQASGLTRIEQCEWLREVCAVAAGEWAACVDDILTTAR